MATNGGGSNVEGISAGTNIEGAPPLAVTDHVSEDHISEDNLSNDGVPEDKGSISMPADDKPSVDNPLKLLDPPALEQQVKEFVDNARDLDDHLEILKRGAQLAQGNPDVLKPLSEKQKVYISDINLGVEGENRYGFLKQSKYLQGSILSTCLAGIVQGWTQSAINGSSVGMRADFGLKATGNTADLWTFGALTAIPFLVGGLLAPLIADPLQEHRLGRRGAIAVACVISIMATIGQSFSKTPAQLGGCRALTGLTLAAKASTAPLLIAETSPKHLRGQLLATWQLSDAFGIFLGFAANLAILGYNDSNKISWRIQTAAVLIPTVALLVVVYLMPESPRYLMKKKKYPKALESFKYLRPSPVSDLLAARDLIYAHFQLEAECQSMIDERERKHPSTVQPNVPVAGSDPEKQKATDWVPLYYIKKTSFLKRFPQTFGDDRSRRALVCASTVMFAQQLTGINTIG
ncbi:MAG: hypothetical protein M1839_005013 [Geoglossum umbratile]|nr:MAG: hypothetical protein M1839_005013 [Geoglossum umbratile]